MIPGRATQSWPAASLRSNRPPTTQTREPSFKLDITEVEIRIIRGQPMMRYSIGASCEARGRGKRNAG